MGKVITGREGPVLGISSSLDLFEKLKHESRRLVDGWHPYDAFNFLVTAWHLFHDWKKCEAPQALSRQKRNERKLPPSMILVLHSVRDLVNGGKHFQLDPEPASKRKVGEVHTGNEVGWYEYFFHEDIAGITVDVHWHFSIRALNNFLVAYFEWVFDDSSPVKSFPGDLDAAISYCNIATRLGKKPPTLYLKGIESAWSKRRTSEV